MHTLFGQTRQILSCVQTTPVGPPAYSLGSPLHHEQEVPSQRKPTSVSPRHLLRVDPDCHHGCRVLVFPL